MTKTHELKRKEGAGALVARSLKAIFAMILTLLLAIPLNMLQPFIMRAHAADSVYLDSDSGHYAQYGGYRTRVMYADSTIVYCADPSKRTPKSGYYEKMPLYTREVNGNQWSTDALAYVLWYGYGGPGFDPAMWPATDEKGEALTSDIYIAVTHILVSDVFACDAGPALTGCDRAFREWIGDGIMGYDSISGTYNDESLQKTMVQNDGTIPCPPEFIDSCFCLDTGSGSSQVTVSFSEGGWIDLLKTSSVPATTDGNDCYSLEGAVYTIYADPSCQSAVTTLTTDSAGFAKSAYLPKGTYFVRETSPSKGYSLDSAIYEVSVKNGKTARVNSSAALEAPQSCPADLWVAKIDEEAGRNVPLGSATLAGAEFTIRYFDGYFDSEAAALASGEPTRRWVVTTDEQGYASLGDASLVAGDALYRNSKGSPTLPLGTILIQETKPPAGYLLGDDTVFVRQITPQGNVETVQTYVHPSRANAVKRGDIEFVKVRELDKKRLSLVPFRLTSKTTGESHIVVTDENGYVNTSASWNYHTYETNFNDDAERLHNAYDPEAGIWFGRTPDGDRVDADDERGALPYDTYLLEELEAPANEGCELIAVDDICVRRDHVTLDLGTIEDPMQSRPYLSTKAADDHDGDSAVSADSSACIRDHVEYMNLIPGTEYTLEASLVYQDVDEAIPGATAERMFIPEASNGWLDITIEADLLAAKGREIVVFEVLRCNGDIVAEHEDRSDSEQTIRVIEPTIATNATDLCDGDRRIIGSADACIVDAVSYSGLAPDHEYLLQATIQRWYPETNEGADEAEALEDQDGRTIVIAHLFTPLDSYGTTEVEIPIDATMLNGCRLTIFEQLYRDGVLIASHEDLMDSGQTVEVAYPHLQTLARDGKDDDKVVVSDGAIKITDEVSLFDVIPGKAYEVYGIVLDPLTGLPLMAPQETDGDEEVPDVDLEAFFAELLDALGLPHPKDGGKIETQALSRQADDLESITLPILPDWERARLVINEHGDLVSRIAMDKKTITPSRSYETVPMDYGFDGRDLDGEAVVCELLVQDGAIVSVHDDLADKGQTVQIVGSALATSAFDASDGDKRLLPGKDATIIDVVDYTDLIAGQEYELQGSLMDKATGKELTIGDAPIRRTLKFTPNEATGNVELSFTFDASAISADTDVVVFEELYKNGELIAAHKDLEAASQTVTVSPSPLGKGYDKTGGDFTALFCLLGALGAAALGAGLYLFRDRLHLPLFLKIKPKH